jgi:hypothetical protein
MSKTDEGIDELRNVIRRLSRLLAKSPWSARLLGASEKLESDAERESALVELRSYLGGMGSLNDVFLCEANKNLPDCLTVEEANRQLGAFFDEAFQYLFPNSLSGGEHALPPRIRHAFPGSEK